MSKKSTSVSATIDCGCFYSNADNAIIMREKNATQYQSQSINLFYIIDFPHKYTDMKQKQTRMR